MTARSVLITGCSSGIGRDAALTLAAHGWRVFAAVRKDADMEPLRDAGLESVHLDYENPASIAAAVDSVLSATGGGLGALVNNGAYAIPGPLEDMPTDALRAIFEANVIGWHDLTRRVIPTMRTQGHGRIVNVSSVLGIVAAPWRGAYNATKHAIEGYTDTLRIEMRDTPIYVITVAPGPIRTPFRQNAIAQFERWVDWERSARVEQYRATLLDRLYHPQKTRFELPPSAVTDALRLALNAPEPRARYDVTVPTRAMGLARRILPRGALDALLSRG
ncbi:SDR family NAD(P)-dependent oxidoreductase [Rhodobacteraceae bacterium CCMM004]|nr:SDR family NAD(P)-dependent oxidoreductase [Rhodobacteraceae bacterium CCMM004]